ncbi:crocetin glucosyltransferase, chloroplastic-like [Rhododendron vialii]|uniref:crocetin glucosyltransferase, chloroplastic-like n=1 Tax=Rhododendron vialii TaxID=182163 RepID=UPI00265F5127|nr:crocetin glucosyltransferase, chloroplastic-like [Rhododendron vialii]
MAHHHFLLVSYPAQGHINPSLQFAKHLVQRGMQVTFVTSVSAQRRISTNSIEIPDGLKFAPYSDVHDGGRKSGDDQSNFFSETRGNSSERLRDIIATSAEEGCPVSCLVYSFLFPWAAKVACDCRVPSSLLWIQPAAVLGIYYYYFNGYKEAIAESSDDPSWSVELPGLPPLHARDLPTFMVSSTSDRASNFILLIFKELIEALDDSETTPTILVNTFNTLEPEALKVIEKYNLIAIGPLIPSAFLGGRDPLENSFRGDLFQKTKDYTEWLNSKPESSVIYVSFGSIVNVQKEQMEEVARGLLETGCPFLWVIRTKENGEEEKEEDRLSCMEELEQQGKIVPWCSQLEVLSHPSLGCFVTHCGWNSTLESLASGVPVVAFPHWSDQGTNARMMADVWRIGVRVTKNEEGIVTSGEVKRCIEIVMGGEEIGEEMRRNAKKWKDSAIKAVKEGGSSSENLNAFLDEFGGD